jgi:hypothetical protein
MSTSPHLSQKLRDALGNDAGSELVGIVDRAASDISELRGDIAEFRHHVDTRFEAMGKLIEQELRKQTQFFFLAWAVILAAIVGLFAR